jgi:DNA repair photolyase
MGVQEIKAKTILRRFRRIDSWFIAAAGLNLYRGCAHDCAYCDGRAEKYQVDGEFARDVAVKVNALDVLRRELGGSESGQQPELSFQEGSPDAPRIRRGLARGFMVLGGGVGDSYQPLETQTLAARSVLELFEDLNVPVHILTKSALVLRDAEVIQRISRKAGALVSFSISTSQDSLGRDLEPGASLPSERLAALAELRRRGVPGGVFLLPVVPCISDSPAMIDQSVCASREAGAQYVLFGGMTLKPGRQKEHFFSVVERLRADLPGRIASLYPPGEAQEKWGQALAKYYAGIGRYFDECALRRRVPPRIPRQLFPATVSGLDLVVVLLEHIGVLLGMEGRFLPFAREAARIARLASAADPSVFTGPAASEVREILATGTCGLYERLMEKLRPSLT